ncbi:MAG: hypothetical protein FWH36_02320 [Lentimicrobiaceae bacterium]|nr:hypothetical protein [Lentimicrobiaceae bacterium]
MKKIITAFTALLFCLNNPTFSQEFYAGLKSGFKLEHYKMPLEKNAINSNYHFQERLLTSTMDFTAPTVQILFRTTFSSNWEVEAGFGWYNYSQKLKAKINTDAALTTFGINNADNIIFSTANERIYGCAFFSPRGGYRVNFSPDLHLRINTGLQIGFLYNARTTSNTVAESDPFELYISYYGVEKPYMNLLISNTISLQYVTKPNIYFSFFVSYHAGLLNVYKNDIYLANRRSYDVFYYNGHDVYVNSAATTKGSYFEFGIELGYVLYKN